MAVSVAYEVFKVLLGPVFVIKRNVLFSKDLNLKLNLFIFLFVLCRRECCESVLTNAVVLDGVGDNILHCHALQYDLPHDVFLWQQTELQLSLVCTNASPMGLMRNV